MPPSGDVGGHPGVMAPSQTPRSRPTPTPDPRAGARPRPTTRVGTDGAPSTLHRLRPLPVPPPPRVVHRDDVPSWVWTGLHLDGVLVPLWRDVARVVGAPDDAVTRAAAFAALVPPRAAVGRLAAVWVHVGGEPPSRVAVLVRSGARRLDPHPDRSTAEADLRDADVEQIGGVGVTTVARTGIDVARWVPAPAAVPALRALQRLGFTPDDARHHLDRHPGARGVRAARSTLALV